VRPLVIVNPRSGGRARDAGSRYWSDLRAVLERRLGPTDLAFTARGGHAIDLARDAAREGRKLVVAVGGDGTLHEVANGILDAGTDAATAIGYVGHGTGGDFRRTFGIDHRLDAYAIAIAEGRERRIDVGQVTYRALDGSTETRWFVNILSAGMSGLVDRCVARTSKMFGGKAAYFWASTRALAESQRARVRCKIGVNGHSEDRRVDSFVIAVCNGRYFGGGMHVAPMAEPDDGRFDVVAIDADTKLAFPARMNRLYAGNQVGAPGVTHFTCDRIAMELESDRARDVFLLDVDGEPLGGLPIDVRLVPGALTLKAP
jgi:YegS/Rv2252/BmrU family lipid kinase